MVKGIEYKFVIKTDLEEATKELLVNVMPSGYSQVR